MKRVALAAWSLLSIGALGHAAYPRIVAWSATSSSILIAEQRATKCTLMTVPVQLRQQTTITPGEPVCHWDGSTGQVMADGTIGYLKNTTPDRIGPLLNARGYKK